MDLKIQAMLRKGAIRLVEKSQNQFLSPIFLVEKKDVGYNSVMNLKKVKSKDSLHSFQNGGSLAFKGDFLCKLDLRDTDFSVAIHKISRKYLRFLRHWKIADVFI